MNKKRWINLCVIAIACIFVVIVGSIVLYGRKEAKTEKIGVIFPGSIEEPGWNGEHYRGIKLACDELGLQLDVREFVEEYSGKCAKEVQEMIDDGIRVIMLESFNYPEEIKNIIEQHPEVDFYCCSVCSDLANYKTYFARVYQARYLSGIVAGLTTKTNQIGYIAAMDNSEVNRGMNAFTLGVKSVNQDATVWATYTGSWDDKETECQNVDLLVKDCNVDVISYHQNQTNVVDEAIALGVDVIGYNIEQGDYSEELLTSVVSNWEMVYKEILVAYMQQKEIKDSLYWIGMEKGAVELPFFSEKVSDQAKQKVEEQKNAIINSKEVFSGIIYDNHGVMRCGENEVIRDELLMNQMDWLVEGVCLYGNDEKEN